VNAPLRLLDRFFVTDRVAIVSGSVNGASQTVTAVCRSPSDRPDF